MSLILVVRISQAKVQGYLDWCVDARYGNETLDDPHKDPIWILYQWLIFDDGCMSDPLTLGIHCTLCIEYRTLMSYKCHFSQG